MKLMIGLLVAAGVAFAVLLGIFLSGMDRFEEEARPSSQALERTPRVFSGVRGQAEPTGFQPQEAPASRLRPGTPINPVSAAERRALQEERRLKQMERERQEAAQNAEDVPPVDEAGEEGVLEELPLVDESLLEDEAAEEMPLEDVPLEGALEDEALLEEEPFLDEGEILEEEVPAEEIPLEEVPLDETP